MGSVVSVEVAHTSGRTQSGKTRREPTGVNHVDHVAHLGVITTPAGDGDEGVHARVHLYIQMG